MSQAAIKHWVTLILVTTGLAMVIGIFTDLNLGKMFNASTSAQKKAHKQKEVVVEPEKESAPAGASLWQKTKDAVGMGDPKPETKFVDLPNGTVQKITLPPAKQPVAQAKSKPAPAAAPAPMAQAKSNYAPVAQAQPKAAIEQQRQGQVQVQVQRQVEEKEDESTPTLDAINSRY